jgi:hypothetical protein
LKFELHPKRKVVPFDLIYSLEKFGEFWGSKYVFCNLQVSGRMRNPNLFSNWANPQVSAARAHSNRPGACFSVTEAASSRLSRAPQADDLLPPHHALTADWSVGQRRPHATPPARRI